MKHVEKAIFEQIKGIVSGRVYALAAPQNALPPFIVYQRTDSARWRSINNPSGIAQAHIQIDAYDLTHTGAREIGHAVEIMLDGYRGNATYGAESVFIEGISLQGEHDLLDETEEPRLFRNFATYLVTYQQ